MDFCIYLSNKYYSKDALCNGFKAIYCIVVSIFGGVACSDRRWLWLIPEGDCFGIADEAIQYSTPLPP